MVRDPGRRSRRCAPATRTHRNLPECDASGRPSAIRRILEEAMADKGSAGAGGPVGVSCAVHGAADEADSARRASSSWMWPRGSRRILLKTMTEIIQEEIPRVAETAVLSGPQPRGGGEPRHFPPLCVAGSQEEKDRGGCPVRLYEPCIPGVHKPGRPWHRGGGCLKECGGPGGRELPTAWGTGIIQKLP